MKVFKRVAFVSIFRKDYGGGEGRVAHELARQFTAQYDTALICPGERTEYNHEADGLKVFYIRSSGQRHIAIPLLSRSNIQRMFGFLDEFQPDIVHIHDAALIGVVAQVWAVMNHVPVVHTSHILPWKIKDFGTSEVIRMPDNFLMESVTTDYLMNFYDNCNALIALNPIVAEGLRKFGYKGRLFVIPNGRALQAYAGNSNADLSIQEILLTFIGFISRRKNQSYLIEVLKCLPENYSLALIGEALDPSYLEQLQYQAALLNNKVIFYGEIPHGEIPSYLERTHVYVSASTMEVQSLALIEALAAGTPVVGLSNETVDELVDDSVGAWLPKDTPEELFAATVRRICEMPQLKYDRLCQNARDRVENLDWSAVIVKTVAAYETLLEERTPTLPDDMERLARMISLIPSQTIQKSLYNWMRSTLSQVQRVRRVSGQTWFFTIGTVLLSLIIYVIFKRPRNVLLKTK